MAPGLPFFPPAGRRWERPGCRVMKMKKTALLLTLLVLAFAIAATQNQSCDLLDGIHHAVMSCFAGILPVPLALGLMLLAFLPLTSFDVRPQLVLVSIDRPPRSARSR